MNQQLKLIEQPARPQNFNRLPTSQRAAAAESKYAEAVDLYASTDLALCRVAEICGVTPGGLSVHISRYHRPLLYARYGLDAGSPAALPLKVKAPRGQSLTTYLKYKEAIEACADLAYIEFNVAQVARLFNVDGTALASQLRVHFPEVLPGRERLRHRLGLADNNHRGARPASVAEYEEALKMYRDTDLTIPQVAERCRVSKGGFSQFMRFYHHDVIATKAARRSAAILEKDVRCAGKLSGNGSLYGPKAATVALYAEALELYRTTSMTIREIADATGVAAEGFKGYLHRWHRGEQLARRGRSAHGGRTTAGDGSCSQGSSHVKYADAIRALTGDTTRSVSRVAAEFGLNADTFRQYLAVHRPDLTATRGMTTLPDGRVVKKTACEKYGPAVRDYAASADSIRKIAQRHGVPYASLMGYLLRNCPNERESHRKMVEKSSEKCL